MNEILNQILLIGYKFIQEIHLSQPKFRYGNFRPFTKTIEKVENFKETGDSKYLAFNIILLIWKKERAKKELVLIKFEMTMHLKL